MTQLRDGGSAAGLDVGERAPAFELPDALGHPVSLDERLRGGAVVLVFYRGAWCPYCNLHLAALQRAQGDIAGAGAAMVAISAQAPDGALDLAEREADTFDVLSDVDQRVLTAYRLRFLVPRT
jgi:peroxiredoxin